MGCSNRLNSKLIRIKVSTYNKLRETKYYKESFDDIINQMIPHYEKRKATQEELKAEIKNELTIMLLDYIKIKGVNMS